MWVSSIQRQSFVLWDKYPCLLSLVSFPHPLSPVLVSCSLSIVYLGQINLLCAENLVFRCPGSCVLGRCFPFNTHAVSVESRRGCQIRLWVWWMLGTEQSQHILLTTEQSFQLPIYFSIGASSLPVSPFKSTCAIPNLVNILFNFNC